MRTDEAFGNLWAIEGATLRAFRRFPAFEEVAGHLVRLPVDNDGNLEFISHRWETPTEPDPDNYQYQVLSSLIKDMSLYWYDYSCSPQRSSQGEHGLYLAYILDNLSEIIKGSNVITIRRSNDDYFSRGWCFHEWFTAQFMGRHERTILGMKGGEDVFEIVRAKRYADSLLCGKFASFDKLRFSKEQDRELVLEATKTAAITCQRKIADTCLEFIEDAIGDATIEFPSGLEFGADDIHARFSRLARFIKAWTLELQIVEPVTDRLAMFFHKGHWDALVNLSQPIAVNLLRLEYSTTLRDNEATPPDREIRKVYELCQRKMPEARYAVTAFLCFFLLGYEINESDQLQDDVKHSSAAECGLISQEFLNAGRYDEAEVYAQAQLKKSLYDFDDEQTEKALSKLGRIHRDAENLDESFKYYSRSLHLSQQMGDERCIAIALDQLGTLHRISGDLTKAIELYHQSLDMHKRMNNVADIGVEYGNLGCTHLQLGEVDVAEEQLRKAIDYSLKANDVRNLSMWSYALGDVFESRGDSAQAKLAYRQALIANTMVGNRNLERVLKEKLEQLGNS